MKLGASTAGPKRKHSQGNCQELEGGNRGGSLLSTCGRLKKFFGKKKRIRAGLEGKVIVREKKKNAGSSIQNAKGKRNKGK